MVYKIYNLDTKQFQQSRNGRIIWTSKGGAITALKYVKLRYKSFGGNPDKVVIKTFQLLPLD